MAAATIHTIMQFSPTPPWAIVIGEFAWFFAHASPPFIYLSMNKTMREGSKRLVKDLVRRLMGRKAGVQSGTNSEPKPSATVSLQQ